MKTAILFLSLGATHCFTLNPLVSSPTSTNKGAITSKTNAQYIARSKLMAYNLAESQSAIDAATESASGMQTTASEVVTATTGVDGLSASTNTIVFIIGLIPFCWATYEFWSRIAVGASFGTGADSIRIRPQSEEMKQLTTIGKDGDLKKSRGQRVLGDDALIVAYILFAIAIGSVSIAVYSVISSPMAM